MHGGKNIGHGLANVDVGMSFRSWLDLAPAAKPSSHMLDVAPYLSRRVSELSTISMRKAKFVSLPVR